MKTGTRTSRLARLAPLAAVAAALAAHPAPAQDVLRAARGVAPPAQAREILQRDPGAFEFRRAWRQKTERVRQARAALEARQGPRLSAPQLRAAGAALTGTLRVPLVLGLYSGATAPFTREQYQERLFGSSTARYSAKTYYQEISRGVFSMDGTATPWQALPQGASYYQNAPSGSIFGRTAEFLRDALLASDASVDFGQFDNDGADGVPNSGDDDGYVDAAAFAYPAQPRSCGGPGIWPHRWTYASWWGTPFTTNDARAGGGTIRVDDYFIDGGVGCDGTSLMEIGTFSHEMGHALGLPDLYDTYSSDGLGEGLGEWDLMASGGYNREDSPAHMSAWSKDFLGWVSVETFTASKLGYTFPTVYGAGTVLRYDIPFSREYFLMEHRAAVQSDAALHGPGLLIYHVDPVVIDSTRFFNRVNGHARQGVDLEEADGFGNLDNGQNRGDASDPFGFYGRTFGRDGHVNSRSYAMSPSGLDLREIWLRDDGTLTMDVGVENGLTGTFSNVNMAATTGKADTAMLRVTSFTGAAVPVKAQPVEPWLTVTPATGTTPGDFSVIANSTGLPQGSRSGSVVFSRTDDPAANPFTLFVHFSVGGGISPGDSVVSALTSQTDVDTVQIFLQPGDTVDVGLFARGDAFFTPSVSLLGVSGFTVATANVTRTAPNTSIVAGYVVPQAGTYRVMVRNSLRSSNYDGRPFPYVVRTRRSQPILDVTGSTPIAYLQQGSTVRNDTVRVYSRGVRNASFSVTVENGGPWLTVTPTTATAAPGAGPSATAGVEAGAGDPATALIGLPAPAAPGTPAVASAPAGAPGDPPVPVVITRSAAGRDPGYVMARVVFNLAGGDVWNAPEAFNVWMRVHQTGGTVLDSTVFAFPGRMALAPDGKLVISSNGSLVKMDPQTGAVTPWVSGLDFELGGMEFGPDSALYVAGYNGRQVLRVTPAGDVAPVLHTANIVTDVDVGPDGTLFVAAGPSILRIGPGGTGSSTVFTGDTTVLTHGIAYHDGYVYYSSRGYLRRVSTLTGVDEARIELPADGNRLLLNLSVGRSGLLYGMQNATLGAVLVMDDSARAVVDKIWAPGVGWGLVLGEGAIYGSAFAPYPRDMVWKRALDDGPAPRGALVGDPSGDGQITSMDALGILSSVVGKPVPAGWNLELKGDANCDGEVTAVDALIILSKVVQKDVSGFCIGSRR